MYGGWQREDPGSCEGEGENDLKTGEFLGVKGGGCDVRLRALVLR